MRHMRHAGVGNRLAVSQIPNSLLFHCAKIRPPARRLRRRRQSPGPARPLQLGPSMKIRLPILLTRFPVLSERRLRQFRSPRWPTRLALTKLRPLRPPIRSSPADCVDLLSPLTPTAHSASCPLPASCLCSPRRRAFPPRYAPVQSARALSSPASRPSLALTSPVRRPVARF